MSYASANIKGFFQASRVPNLVMIAVVQILTSVYLLRISVGELLTVKFLALVTGTLMIAAGGYIINDYYDQKIDLINRPKRVVVGIKLQRRPAMGAHFLLNLTSIVLGFWVSIYVGVINVFSIFMLWFYSNRLRQLPLIGNLTIGFLHSLVILITMSFFRELSKTALAYALFAFVISVIRELIKDIQDVKGESAFGCSTIPVIWGVRGTKYVIYTFSMIGIGLLIAYLLVGAADAVRVYFITISPFFGWFLYRIHRADTNKEYEALHRIINGIILSGIISILFVR